MTGTMLADRALLRLSGAETRDFLQGLVTSDVRDVAPGRPVWTGLLTPQGKALFDMILWADGDDVLIDAEAEQAEALMRRLALYRLRRPVAIERDHALAVHWAPERPSTGDAVPDPRLPALGWRWIGPAGEAAEGWLAHRLSLGVAEGVEELGSGETLWLECNARELNGVSFTKGCYVGQENTARMHHRSKINRRLVVAPVNADDRMRVAYPALGRMVTHRRVEALGDAVIPAWLRPAMDD